MSIALIASNQSLVEAVASLLRSEGLKVAAMNLDDAGFMRAGELDSESLGVLLQPQQGADTILEQVERVRKAFSQQQRLLVCSPQLTPAHRQILVESGADRVLTPASWGAAHVAERVFAEILLEHCDLTIESGELRGGARLMRELYRHIDTLAALQEPVLICGETGTGKELVARELHLRGNRQNVFLPINCAELSPELLNTELFGHEKGAFTNALQQRKGLLVAAQAGTAFLDEIGELDLQAQAKLLRVIEEKQVRPLGSNRWEKVPARILLATNRRLDEEAELGRFRPDLLERIRGFTLDLPPLRERKADLVLLAHHFVAEYNTDYQCNLKIPPGALDCLFRGDWLGNVRELRAAVRKAAAYADEKGNINSLLLQESCRVRRKSFDLHKVSFDPSSDTWRDVQKRTQAAYFRSILTAAGGNKEIAIKLSGLSRAQFYEKLKDID